MKNTLILTTILVFVFALYPQKKEIREDMVVINVEVPVRVMYKGKPVDSLKKSDFQLFENGVRQEINGFYLTRKKIRDQQIGITSEKTEKYKPRYFVLVFRLYKKTKSVEDAIDYLFNKVMREQDKILLFINNKTLYFDNTKTKDEIVQIIDSIVGTESQAARYRFEKAYQKISQDLKSAWFQSSLDGGGAFDGRARMNPAEAYRFLQNYKRTMKEYKRLFLTPDIGVYYNFSQHLKKINLEKWVLTFYQFEKFPKFKVSGRLKQQLGADLDRIEMDLNSARDFPSEAIAKMFYKVNTTFHSMFFTAYEDVHSRDLELKTISTDLENSFRAITNITGGDLIVSNKLDLSLEKVTEKEDVFYMLTYSPTDAAKKGKVKVTVSDRKYDVHYDDNIRADYISNYLIKKEAELSVIKPGEISFENKKLSLGLKDIMLRKIKGKLRGRISIRIQIKDPNGKSIFDQKKIIETKQKGVDFKIGFKWMKPGDYNLLIDAVDLLTGKSVFVYESIHIEQ